MQKMKPLTARAECTVFALCCLLGANSRGGNVTVTRMALRFVAD